MLDGFDKFAEGIGKAIETVPDLYDDTFKSTMQESGKTLALIPRAINAALIPLRKWIAERECSLAETEKLLAKKLEHIDPDKIISPEAYVAVPAIQSISYSMNSEELRNLYANLLAKAMNSDTKDLVHPSFVEIIKQMSPADALVFKTIMGKDANPLINLIYKNEDGRNINLNVNITDIDIASVENVGVSIDNLIKQSLISIPADWYYAKEYLYEKLLSSKQYKIQQQIFSNPPDDFKLTYKKQMIEKTNLGKAFYKICIADF